jgi:hypothetical protein
MPLCSLALLLLAQAPDLDTDGDGLSDFHERHKYFTDPTSADSDGDGVPDGDWNERREFTYSVRSILQVLPPVTLDVLCDDYQDARILLATDELVELEVVHYPLNTVASTLAADPDWRATVGARSDLAPYLASTTTSDFDADMAREFAAELAKAGLDLATVDDKTLVERATRWILDHTAYQDSFTTFCSTFEGGAVRVLPGLESTAEQGLAQDGLTLEDSWQRELFARGMWRNKMHGSCTSSAIFWTGCLRALGIPTRIVLCTPVIDATDEREWKLAERALTRQTVRAAVLGALENSRGGWTSHTFNEVFVGGRWRRLNYERLGQNTLDRDYLGLMTHVATFRDWADGGFAKTWGKRQAGDHDDVLGFGNPYSALSLTDLTGLHATLAHDPVLPPRPIEGTVTIDAAYWSDDPSLPDWVLDLRARPPFLALHVVEWTNWPELKAFTAASDRRFTLEAEGRATLGVQLEVGGWTSGDGSVRLLYLPLGGADWSGLVKDVDYRLVPRNQGSGARWVVSDDLRIRRAAR